MHVEASRSMLTPSMMIEPQWSTRENVEEEKPAMRWNIMTSNILKHTKFFISIDCLRSILTNIDMIDHQMMLKNLKQSSK